MGRFLHKFQTENEFIEAYNDQESYQKPWVSLTKETEEINYNKEEDFQPEKEPVFHDVEA